MITLFALALVSPLSLVTGLLLALDGDHLWYGSALVGGGLLSGWLLLEIVGR